MLDQLRELRDQLDRALAALEPLAPALNAWAANRLQEAQEGREAAPATISPPPDHASAPGEPRVRPCAVCGEQFRAQGRKRYCSDRCRNNVWRRLKAAKQAAATARAAETAPPDLAPPPLRLPDQIERPLRGESTPDASDPAALRPPPLPWESNGAAP